MVDTFDREIIIDPGIEIEPYSCIKIIEPSGKKNNNKNPNSSKCTTTIQAESCWNSRFNAIVTDLISFFGRRGQTEIGDDNNDNPLTKFPVSVPFGKRRIIIKGSNNSNRNQQLPIVRIKKYSFQWSCDID